MPKETFFNLPAAKREHIIDVAIAEFANHDYANVSISRIVARAGIAKGSFYQYFEDKEDLYNYLVELIAQKKREMFSLEHPAPQQIGIFRYLHWIARTGVQFELAYPDLVRIGYRMAHSGTLSAVQARYRDEMLAFYKRLIAKGKEQGDIAPDIDEDLAAFLFEAVFSSLAQHLLPRIALHSQGQAPSQTFFELPDVVRIFDQAIDILERGLGTARRTPEGDPAAGSAGIMADDLPQGDLQEDDLQEEVSA